MAVDYGVCMGKLSRNGISGQDSSTRMKKKQELKRQEIEIVELVNRAKSKLTGKEETLMEKETEVKS